MTFSVGCLWHTSKKKCGFIVRTITKPPNRIAENLYRLLFSSSKLTNGIVQNLHRFSIDLLPMNNQNVLNLSLVSFPLEVQDGLLTMVGDLFPNQDTIYVRFFPMYTCNHSCYTIDMHFFATYTCVLSYFVGFLFPSI